MVQVQKEKYVQHTKPAPRSPCINPIPAKPIDGRGWVVRGRLLSSLQMQVDAAQRNKPMHCIHCLASPCLLPHYRVALAAEAITYLVHRQYLSMLLTLAVQ